MGTAGKSWKLSLAGEATVCVAPTLRQMTPYVLLEQEDWFEDEIRFIRRWVEPGMAVLDIGANHGVYALSMAARLGPGRVWAFEPTAMPREKLIESIAENRFGDTVTVIPAALSDSARDAPMAVAEDSELNTLHGGTGRTEMVRVRTLDACAAEYFPDVRIDFVKLDAEEEELAILRGGARVFAEQSPLVMFEAIRGDAVSAALLDAFRALGYGLFFLAPEAGVLLPYREGQGECLNLFACKPDRAETLRARGLLLSWDDVAREAGDFLPRLPVVLARLEMLPFAAPWIDGWSAACLGGAVPQAYAAALAAALEAADATAAPERRLRLWLAGWESLGGLPPQQAARAEVGLLKLHFLHALGNRDAAVALAADMERRRGLTDWPVMWPVLPPLPESLARVSTLPPGEWAGFRVAEFITLQVAHSSYFDLRGFLQRLPLHVRDPDRLPRTGRMMVLLLAKGLHRFCRDEALSFPRNRAAWRDVADGIIG
ncbi:FkbM family methyltransferase [Oleispirillum naphthae]|uniref:FkbM family methyltransferase n=1 Tax=Oleispirillum naphthae TaxID=2838853 RepID=UPI0030823E8C